MSIEIGNRGILTIQQYADAIREINNRLDRVGSLGKFKSAHIAETEGKIVLVYQIQCTNMGRSKTNVHHLIL